MIKLDVPYQKQINDYACGAACLLMVYQYYGLSDIKQKDIYEAYKESEPHGTSNLRITTDDLVGDANSRGFQAKWGRVDWNDLNSAEVVVESYLKRQIPLIVCRQFPLDSLMGHFVVIVGMDEDNFIVHDPYPKLFGGQYKSRNKRKFMESWAPTGNNVTGGIYVEILKN